MAQSLARNTTILFADMYHPHHEWMNGAKVGVVTWVSKGVGIAVPGIEAFGREYATLVFARHRMRNLITIGPYHLGAWRHRHIGGAESHFGDIDRPRGRRRLNRKHNDE